MSIWFNISNKNLNVSKKSFWGFQDSWFSYVWWNFKSVIDVCWELRINLDAIYLLKDYNSDIRSCINLISKKTSLNWLLLINDKGEELDPKKNFKEYDYLNSLFSKQTFDFWKKVFFTNTFLSWENYIEPIYNWAWTINQALPIDSRGISKNINSNGQIDSFQSTTWVMNIDELLYSMYEMSSKNENESIWLINGIMYDVLNDMQSNKKNYSFFKNSWVPNAVFMLDPSMDKETAKLFKEEIDRKFSWTSNAYKSITSQWISWVQTLNISNKDVELIALRQMSTDKITSAFWVSKKLIGYTSDTWSYSEIKEIRADFNQSTIAGIERYLEAVLNLFIQKYAKDLKVDLSKYKIKCNWEAFSDKAGIEASQNLAIELWIRSPWSVATERGLEIVDKAQNKIYIRNNLVWISNKELT